MRLPFAAALTAILTASGVAGAQEADERTAIALNQFDPSVAGDPFFVVPSGLTAGEPMEARARLGFDFGLNPLRLQSSTGDATVVSSQSTLHIGLSLALLDRFMVSAQIPAAVQQAGDDPQVGEDLVQSPSSAALGDVRLGARFRLAGDADGPIHVGTGLWVYLPTASDLYVGDGSVRETPYLALGGRFDAGVPFRYNAFFGAAIRGAANGSAIRYGAGIAAYPLDDAETEQFLQVGVEVYGTTPLQDPRFELSPNNSLERGRTTNLEGLVGAKLRVWRMVFGLGGGPGMTSAIGTPAFRLAATIGYEPLAEAPEPEFVDFDADGIADAKDACPHAAGPRRADEKRHGCPDLDDDEDGVPNYRDKCPNEWATPRKNGDGCPMKKPSTTIEGTAPSEPPGPT